MENTTNEAVNQQSGTVDATNAVVEVDTVELLKELQKRIFNSIESQVKQGATEYALQLGNKIVVVYDMDEIVEAGFYAKGTFNGFGANCPILPDRSFEVANFDAPKLDGSMGETRYFIKTGAYRTNQNYDKVKEEEEKAKIAAEKGKKGKSELPKIADRFSPFVSRH